MRTKFLFYFVLLILFVSCSSSDDGGTGEFIIADVGTLNFESSNIPNAVTAAKIESSDTTTYIVQGFDDAANAIVLFIADYDGPGTYEFSFSEENNGTSGLFSDLNNSWSSNGGQDGAGIITVLTDTANETTGRFEFVGVDANNETSTKTTTNGSFRAFY